MERIRISEEGRCAQGKYCFPVAGDKKARQKWIETNDLFVDDDGRAMALVDSPTRVYFMDAVTGSLYQFGNCLTSDVLKSENINRNKIAAQTILMGMSKNNDSD